MKIGVVHLAKLLTDSSSNEMKLKGREQRKVMLRDNIHQYGGMLQNMGKSSKRVGH
jgi:hypothetical protein